MAVGLITYMDNARREDLLDIIKNVDPFKTPFLSDCGRAKAQNTYHEWLVDGYAASAHNAVAEGIDATVTDLTQPQRKGNVTQIFRKVVQVSGTEKAVNIAGMNDPEVYQMKKAMIEIGKDMERALIAGTTASGGSGVARQLAGAIAQITTNKTLRASGTSFSETEFNDICQDIYNQTDEVAEVVYAGASMKRDISKFTAGSTKYTETKDKKLINTVSVYESDFGVHNIKLSREIPTAANGRGVLFAKKDLWRVAELRPVKYEKLAKTGDAEKGMIIGEITLEGLNEKASAYRSGY
jgi:energy-coupling factor transporter ATP-binding protein EcfA2